MHGSEIDMKPLDLEDKITQIDMPDSVMNDAADLNKFKNKDSDYEKFVEIFGDLDEIYLHQLGMSDSAINSSSNDSYVDFAQGKKGGNRRRKFRRKTRRKTKTKRKRKTKRKY
tara:strand:+ start:285 stop:623 length:339 start_codon:yes stop_codon:yes gene_type:complete